MYPRKRVLLPRQMRLVAFLLLLVSMIALLGLASGLGTVDMSPGTRFPIAARDLSRGLLGFPSLKLETMEAVWSIVAAVFVWVLLPLSLLYFLVSPTARRRLLRYLSRVIPLILWAMALMIVFRRLQLTGHGLGNARSQALSRAGVLATPPDIVVHPPRWIVLATSLLFSVLLVLVVWSLWRRLQRPMAPLKDISQPAREAIAQIQIGADLQSVVIRCYADMSRVVRETRGLRRPIAMTAREFEAALVSIGLPAPQVGCLTRLFEGARYSGLPLGAQQEGEAVDCLKAIVKACEAT